MTIKLRGHHLLCMLTNEGIGYTQDFAQNFDQILARLSGGENIEIVDGPDEVCAALINSRCQVEVHCHRLSVRMRDKLALNAVGQILDINLSSGSVIAPSANYVKELREAFRKGSVRRACHKCQWHEKCTSVAANGFEGARL